MDLCVLGVLKLRLEMAGGYDADGEAGLESGPGAGAPFIVGEGAGQDIVAVKFAGLPGPLVLDGVSAEPNGGDGRWNVI